MKNKILSPIDETTKQGAEAVFEKMGMNLSRDGLAFEKVAHYVQMPVEWVQNLTETAD